MSQFIESIKIENGKIFLLDFHQNRINQTFSFFEKTNHIDLKAIIKNLDYPTKGLFKLRIVYDFQRIIDIQITPYTSPKFNSFEIIENSDFSYRFKFLDRTILNEMKKKSKAEEIIITQKGYITDTSFSNILFLKKDTWHTPESYLLNGVQRQYLLKEKKIKETKIHIDNLQEYSHFQIINAMNTLNPSCIYPIETIINLP